MSLSTSELAVSISGLHGKKFRRLTGVYERDFYTILKSFDLHCQSEKHTYKRKGYEVGQLAGRKPGGGRKAKLSSSTEKLYFVLYFLKNYPTMIALADHFKLSAATACTMLKTYLCLLQKTLGGLGVLPVREWKSEEEVVSYLQKEKLDRLIVDATERFFHRPKDKDAQKAVYSGKKKCHSIKNTLITCAKKYIHFLGYTTQGSTHDLRLLELDLEKVTSAIFRDVTLLADLGYLGIEKYFDIRKLEMPFKRPRKSETNPEPTLTEEQKAYNKACSAQRVIIEHAIGSMKHFKALTEKFRNFATEKEDLFIEIIAGLHNLQLKQMQ